MKQPLHALAQRCKRFLPLLAAPAALLLIQGEAKAILTYNIFESAGNVVVQTSGSLILANPQGPFYYCGFDGAIDAGSAAICTGADPSTTAGSAQNFYYYITGPSTFDGPSLAAPADSVSGLFTILWGGSKIFSIDNSYASGTPFVSSATFNGTTLAALGFTTTGLIGTWTIDGTSESINVCIGADPCGGASVPGPLGASVPGPLPLIGAGAAFGWSRRLRKRIAAPLITPPQA